MKNAGTEYEDRRYGFGLAECRYRDILFLGSLILCILRSLYRRHAKQASLYQTINWYLKPGSV